MDSVFQGVLSGVGQVFLVAAAGLIGRLLGVITETTLRELTRVAIAIALPCFYFEAIMRDFAWVRLASYATVVGAAVVLLALGLGLGWLAARLARLPEPDCRLVMALSGFNNSINMPVPLAVALLPQSQADSVIVLFTLYNLIWAPLLWSLGVWLIAPHANRGLRRGGWRLLITPPGVAVVAGILAKTPPLAAVFEAPQLKIVHRGVEWVGTLAVPLCLLILGGILGGLLHRLRFHPSVVTLVTTVKMFALPGLVLICLRLGFPSDHLVALGLLIQAAAPPATNTILIAEHCGGDTDTIGATLLFTYLLAMATMALWLSALL